MPLRVVPPLLHNLIVPSPLNGYIRLSFSLTIMWPDNIIRSFKVARPARINPSGKIYSGAYNKLLNTLFPVKSDFTVVPRYIPDRKIIGEFTTMFEILLGDKLVLIVDLTPGNNQLNRAAADDRIRIRMIDVVGELN